MKKLLLILHAIFILPAIAAAGDVYSQTCPYSCRSNGYPKSHCKDWKIGTTCYIEILSQSRYGTARRTGKSRSTTNGRKCWTYGNGQQVCEQHPMHDEIMRDMSTATSNSHLRQLDAIFGSYDGW